MSNEVVAALSAITGRGAFATDLVCASGSLNIAVEGVGPLRFPISPTVARKLCEVAKPAPFGRRDQTLHDKNVRDSWEIDSRKVKIDKRSWRTALDSSLEQIHRDLGLPEGGSLEAVLDKLLIYGPGQFFAPHQDSERADNMVGTLIVEFPCQHEGGSLVVEHNGEKRIFRGRKRGPTDLALYAFYADCHHEVKPVKAGYRISLTYHLLFHGEDERKTPQAIPGSGLLAGAIKDYFSTPKLGPSYSRMPAQKPDRLVYLLDHEYTQRSLKFAQLKRVDRLRVEALASTAECLDCEMFLALADVHESWSCSEDDSEYGYGRRRYGRWSYDEDEEEYVRPSRRKAEDYELDDLIASDIELRHFVDMNGKVVAGLSIAPPKSEICFTRASSEMNPFKLEHEGYMGNYGNTVDRWYHRAAVIMWPRERNFVIRAKAAPSSAMKELRSLIKSGALDEAQGKAKDLLPFWGTVANRDSGARFFSAVASVAVSMDADTAFGLLSPFGPERLEPGAIPTFAALVERNGTEWGKRLIIEWKKGVRFDTPRWLPLIPLLVEALIQGEKYGKAFATWLLNHEIEAFRQRHVKERTAPVPFGDARRVKEYLEDLAGLFLAVAVAGEEKARDDLIDLVVGRDTELPPEIAGDLFKVCSKASERVEVKNLGLDKLYEHVVGALKAAMVAPTRSADDWSIDPPTGCACVLCKELAVFLRARDRVKFEWPLAKDRRSHVHSVIARHELPVTHTTVHTGSPHKLILTKQRALFDREKDLRQRQKVNLDWLLAHGGRFLLARKGQRGRQGQGGGSATVP